MTQITLTKSAITGSINREIGNVEDIDDIDDVDDIPQNHKIINDENTYSNVYYKIKPLLLAVFLTFLVSYIQFPGFISRIKSQHDTINNSGIYPMELLAVLTFNTGEYFGRNYLANWTSLCFSKGTLWIGALWRIVIIPVILLMCENVINNDIAAFIFIALLGLTNGWFCCLCFILAPSCVNNNEQALCGTMMTCALVSGITFGSWIALLLSSDHFLGLL